MVRFETSTEVLGDRTVIRLRGYLSGQAGERLEGEVGRILGLGTRALEIDFADTDLVNSVGVSILIGVIEKVGDAGGTLSFSGLTPVNEEIFRIMGLDNHVTIKGAPAGREKSSGRTPAKGMKAR